MVSSPKNVVDPLNHCVHVIWYHYHVQVLYQGGACTGYVDALDIMIHLCGACTKSMNHISLKKKKSPCGTCFNQYSVSLLAALEWPGEMRTAISCTKYMQSGGGWRSVEALWRYLLFVQLSSVPAVLCASCLSFENHSDYNWQCCWCTNDLILSLWRVVLHNDHPPRRNNSGLQRALNC